MPLVSIILRCSRGKTITHKLRGRVLVCGLGWNVCQYRETVSTVSKIRSSHWRPAIAETAEYIALPLPLGRIPTVLTLPGETSGRGGPLLRIVVLAMRARGGVTIR